MFGGRPCDVNSTFKFIETDVGPCYFLRSKRVLTRPGNIRLVLLRKTCTQKVKNTRIVDSITKKNVYTKGEKHTYCRLTPLKYLIGMTYVYLFETLAIINFFTFSNIQHAKYFSHVPSFYSPLLLGPSFAF